jgi:hypothetical protein
MQVPTARGWVFVNPYMTLVAGYERLIGGRGREVSEDIMIARPATPAPAVETAAKSAQEEVPTPAAIEKTESIDTAAAHSDKDAVGASVQP